MLALVLLTAPAAVAQQAPRYVTALSAPALREWDDLIERSLRDGALDAPRGEADSLLPGRRHERYRQLHQGVRVFGGEIVRQSDAAGTLSVFGTLYEGIQVDARPTLRADDALRVVERLAHVPLGPALVPELVVLPRPERAGYALAWRVRAATPDDVRVWFIDAHQGTLLFDYSDLKTAAAVGTGRGVFGDLKKVSADSLGSSYIAYDRLRPAATITYDLAGDLQKLVAWFNGFSTVTSSDRARDGDNDWRDGAIVDAHVYAGYTYDYFFKRFGRHGIDGADRTVHGFVHPLRREYYLDYPPTLVGALLVNAAYVSPGVVIYGDGLPPGATLNGQGFDYFAGALDIVAHEWTHGVTDYSSDLIYLDEPGALNEAFSDVMATGAEFFHQERGDGPLKADWLAGEDIAPPGLRSFADPGRFGDPDHYSRRYVGPRDNGGVHINSGIVNQAFFLAVEGGRNRTSGLSVQGVGFDNREQIEKAFYRAFVNMLTPRADFRQARAATLTSARDLYGAGGTVERALAQAWTAVGVE